MNRKFVVCHLTALLTVTSLHISNALAYEEPTHVALSLRAVSIAAADGGSSLDDYLKQVLNFEFPDGVLQSFNGKQVRQWIQLGSNDEDSPLWRVQEHFHDPTKLWNQAGPITGGISSVIWSQTQNQDNGVGSGNHSWKDARDSYFNALTATNTAQRQQHWADTFQSLGHLMHLIQDASSPAHTRNDLHFSLWGIGDTDRLHVWGNKTAGLAAAGASGSLRYDPSILNLPPNNLAPIPIARIIDTEKLKAGIPSEGLDIGIAEYSNANFFSDNTIFDSNYQTPTDLGLVTESGPGPNGKLTEYLYRHPGSAGAYRLAVSGAVASSTTVPITQRQWDLDDKVMESYAEKLFPRAIGYSAGLIDYFFRNFLSGYALDVGCVTPPFPTEGPFATYGLSVLNFPSSSIGSSVPSEQVGPGRIVVVAHYRDSGQDHHFVLMDTTGTINADEGTRWFVSSAPMAQIPATATQIYFTIAYRGPLGQETDAVIGGVGGFVGLC